MQFKNTFDPLKDLVYGLTGQRAVYFEAWRDYQDRMLTVHQNFSINNRYFYINDFNEPISGGNFNDPDAVQLDQNQDQTQREFLDALGETRYTPYDIKEVDTRRLLATGDFANLNINPANLTSQQLANLRMLYAVRRACKFGIKYILADNTGALHYILDGIVMNEVVSKATRPLFTGDQGVPITTSELRFIFRYWHLIKNNRKFIFWQNFNDVIAPWEQNPQDWLPYARQRVEKYRFRLQNGVKSGQLYGFDRAVVTNNFRLAIILFHDMKITEFNPLQ